jgi:hypothetical protein
MCVETWQISRLFIRGILLFFPKRNHQIMTKITHQKKTQLSQILIEDNVIPHVKLFLNLLITLILCWVNFERGQIMRSSPPHSSLDY